MDSQHLQKFLKDMSVSICVNDVMSVTNTYIPLKIFLQQSFLAPEVAAFLFHL